MTKRWDILIIISGLVGFIGSFIAGSRAFVLMDHSLSEDINVFLGTSGFIFSFLAGLFMAKMWEAVFDLLEKE